MKSRKELLEYFQELLRLYPHNPHLERVQKTTAMLERMVKEDEQHPTITEAELIKLPEEAQVKEWIFRLRDQNGHQWSQPGWCDIFDHMGGNNGGASPAHKLVALGYAAVPQLIEVLGDDHLTRSVGFHRDFHFSHTVLTVGDCAEQILQRISGQTFYAPASTSSYMSRDEEVSATKERVSKWWKDFQAKGERASLVEAIASGTKAPYELVQKLREKYPEAVDEAVLMGAQKATNDWVFRNYLELVGQSSAPAAMDYLRKQLKEGKNQSHRVTAARLLWNKKIPEALPAAIAEWQTALTQPAPQSSPHDGLTDLMTFLISTGNKDAMTALVRDADRLEVNRRHELITQLGEQLAQRPKPMQVFKPDPDPAVLESAEWYLVHELEDTATRNGMSGSYGDFSFVDPRLCDFALWALHRMLPERYAFSSKAGRGQRDRERIQAANIWREAHHQALLDLPEFHLAKVDAKDTLKITSVRIVPPQEKAPAVGLIQDLQSIQGQALSKSVMMQLLTSQMTDKDCRHKGLTLQFTRDDDLTGVHLVAEVGIKSRPTASGSANAQASVTLDEQRLISSTLTPTHEVNELESRWREVLTQADQALQSAPTTSFIISIHIDPQP